MQRLRILERGPPLVLTFNKREYHADYARLILVMRKTPRCPGHSELKKLPKSPVPAADHENFLCAVPVGIVPNLTRL